MDIFDRAGDPSDVRREQSTAGSALSPPKNNAFLVSIFPISKTCSNFDCKRESGGRFLEDGVPWQQERRDQLEADRTMETNWNRGSSRFQAQAGLPLDIGKLINMQRMVLANNMLQILPNTIGCLRSLKILALDGNRITVLPDELGNLSRLEQLSLSENLLTCLPDTFGKLHNLSLLNLSNNQLKSLPAAIGGCASLEELQANDNSIEELPETLCNLAHLKSLLLNNNRVNKLPRNLLKDCRSMHNLSLHGNLISMNQFQQMAGFEEYEARRRKKFDKQIDSNILMNSKGLDEGLDL